MVIFFKLVVLFSKILDTKQFFVWFDGKKLIAETEIDLTKKIIDSNGETETKIYVRLKYLRKNDFPIYNFYL